MKKIEAMILSMTPPERRRPEILTLPRRTRIAKGSGVQLEEVNRLIKRFEDFKKMGVPVDQIAADFSFGHLDAGFL